MADSDFTVSQTLEQTLGLIQQQLDILGAQHDAIPSLLVTMSDGQQLILEARGVKYLHLSTDTPPWDGYTPQTIQ